MIITHKKNDIEILFLVEESDEGGYIARSLHHSIYTEAETIEKLREMIRDAVTCHFGEDCLPDLIRLHIVRDEIIAI